MGLVVTYYMPADASSGPWTENLSGAVRLGTIDGIIDEAELGAPGISSLLFDDPLGTLGTSHYPDGIRGLKRLWIDETAAPAGNQRLWTGWIADRHYKRGTDSLITGVARKLDVTLIDANTMLSFRVFAPVNGSNSNEYNASNSFIRPAETDLARVAALLTVPFLTSVHDTGFISTGTGVAMDACDYTGQHPADVLNDCAQQSGRNFFIRYDESANEFSLHYVDEGSLSDAATIRISNVLADVDNVTTFAPEPDLELVRDPSRVSAAVYLPFNGSNSPAYKTRIQTEYDYGWRDSSAPSSNVKTIAKANVRALRYLDTTKTEDDRITCTLRGLPASKVTAIKQGQIVQAKFSHLPNGSNATWGSAFQPMRVLNRNIMANEQTNVRYNVRYELSPIPPVGFAQLVLSSASGTGVATPSGEYLGEWNGAEGGGYSTPTPVVIQDTAGFTGTVGNLRWGGPQVTSWTIPTGFGGHYNVGFEALKVDNAWWPLIYSYPQPVPYIYGGGGNACSPCVANVGASVTYAICANGTPVASASAVYAGGGLGYWVPEARLGPTDVSFNEGDVITFTLTFTGYLSGAALTYGIEVFGTAQGVLVMTRTGS